MTVACALLMVRPGVGYGQQVPARPPSLSDQQLQQALQRGASPEMIRQRIQQSGLTPDEVRARLQQAGYPAALLDAYMGDSIPSRQAVPDTTLSAALSALGLAGLPPMPAESLPLPVPARAAPPARDTVRGLRLFGSEVFERSSSQFQPLLTGPVDADYRLGPGDQLVLILTGAVQLAHQLEVTREGFIVIPQVGQLWVSGLTLAQLTDLLYTRLGEAYSGIRRSPGATTRFQVSISRLRMNQIFVIGEVNRPGAYQVPSVATLFYALYLAGGPTTRGSYREITVRRAGRTLSTLDIYDYLQRGDNSHDVRLESGDVLFVPVRPREVSIQGSVVRPARYELRAGDGLRELVRLAGGVAPNAFVRRVQIDRILPPPARTDPAVDRVLLDVDVAAVLDSSHANVPLESGDSVSVFSVLQERRNYVTVTGSVFRPGRYQYTPGMALWDLIAQTRGLISDTYLERAQIFRREADYTRRLISVSLDSDSAVRRRDNPALQDLDSIVVYGRRDFRSTRTVSVSGAVRHAAVFPYYRGMTLRDAVIAAGGLSDDAYLSQAEVARLPVRRTGDVLADTVRVPLDSTYIVDRDSARYLGPPGLPGPAAGAPEFALEPFDHVLILRQPGWELHRTVAIAGQVSYPGRYALLSREERLLDLVHRAGGLTTAAYVRGTQFYRPQGALGRVGIDFERVLKDPGYRDNVILFNGDSVYVPEYQPTVKVEGAVGSPVTVAYRPGAGVDYYVDRAGGYARRADRGRAYVTQPNGALETRGARPEPGSRVTVPQVPETETGTNWASVLGSVATILTSALTIILVVQRL